MVRRTFVRNGSFSLERVSLGIVFFSPDKGFVAVYLGEINFIDNFSKWRYSVENADEVKADLLNILHRG